MTPADLTLILSAVGGLVVALTAARGAAQSARKAVADAGTTTWQGLSAEYKAERDSLRVQVQDLKQQITALETEVDTLRARVAGTRSP